LFQEI